MKKIKYVIGLIVLVLLFLITFLYLKNIKKEYNKNLFYMDTYINIKVKTNLSKNKVDSILNGCEDIYNKYQKLTNVYSKDSDIYYINTNTSDDETLTIDKDLYSMIDLGLSWYKKSNNKFNINMGSVIAVWKKYRENENGIPSIDELKESGSIDINNIKLLGNNKIQNTKPNIDLGAISKGYATKEVGKYLKENGLLDFVINAGGNVLVGNNTIKDCYSIGVENPENTGEIYATIKGNNIAVVTSGGYERFYEYEGVRYHHIIDPDTLYPSNNSLSVTIISSDSALADILSTSLFLMEPNDAIKFINNIDDAEAIIYVNSNTILKSKGYSKYE